MKIHETQKNEISIDVLRYYGQTNKEANSNSNNLRMISVNSLLSSKKKSRKHSKKQLEKLKRCIKKVGFTMPIVVNEQYEIIAGELRLKAAQEQTLM